MIAVPMVLFGNRLYVILNPNRLESHCQLTTAISPIGGRNCPTMRCTSFLGRLLIAVALFSVTTTSVSAGWHELMNHLRVGFQRNNAWPDPFNEMDAMSVIMPFEAMKHNGWVLHNTIGAHQFRATDGALNTSGQESLAWIARQAPAGRRHIYIVRASTDQETEARVAAVNEMLAQLTYSGSEPTVMLTDRTPPTAPGDWATHVNRAWLTQLAAPKLPSTSASGTAGSTR